MTYICLCGQIVKLQDKEAIIQCREDGERVSVQLEEKDSFELEVGDEGIFVGYQYQEEITVQKIELMKFLDPYFQKDLIEGSSQISIVPLVNNPFPALFKSYFTKQELDV